MDLRFGGKRHRRSDLSESVSSKTHLDLEEKGDEEKAKKKEEKKGTFMFISGLFSLPGSPGR
jgi:hypothetical protein